MTDPRRISRRPRRGRLLWPLLVVAGFAGCTVMEGVNVGAAVPIGGIGSVGANTTIGRGRAPAPSQQKPADESKEPSADSEEPMDSPDDSSADSPEEEE